MAAFTVSRALLDAELQATTTALQPASTNRWEMPAAYSFKLSTLLSPYGMWAVSPT